MHYARQMSLQRLAFRLRNSLWFIPGLWVIGAALLALLMTWVDSANPGLGTDLPLVFGGGPDGARSVLSSIAGSTITVAGVTFSISIVALQLASSQFSPRVLRDFMRDRLSQSVLGSFLGAFFYALLVMRSIRSQDDSAPEFVPALSVTVGILLAAVAVIMLVYFIHHISTRIQVSSILAAIASAAEDSMRRATQGREGADRTDDLLDSPLPAEEPGSVPGTGSGYLQLVDSGGLVELAKRRDLVLRIERPVGDWAQAGAPLFSVWPAAVAGDELARELNDHVTIGAERSLEQDPAFGIRQLVDVAVKALSPGINDPTTARDCISRVTQLLVARAGAGSEAARYADDDGRVRLVRATRGFEELVSLGFDEIRHYGAATPDIAIAIAEALASLKSQLPERHRSAVDGQSRLLQEAAQAIEPEGDRRRALAAIQRASASG